jgi:hypothetical protein
MSLFCRLFGCRRFRTVRIYKGFSARRVACTHCGRNYVMHEPTRSFLPWDDEFADMYEDWT